nr:FCD domain-containing protein [Streptomyces violaceorubidus]
MVRRRPGDGDEPAADASRVTAHRPSGARSHASNTARCSRGDPGTRRVEHRTGRCSGDVRVRVRVRVTLHRAKEADGQAAWKSCAGPPRHSTHRRSSRTVAAEHMTAMAATDDPERLLDHDLAFHQVVVPAAGNETLAGLVEGLSTRTLWARPRLYRGHGDDGALVRTRVEQRPTSAV